ncbi:DNA repair protein RecN [hydrothermal vent metagenome]|uniref:DNA repair protein RecN n=1 Tax=hydrothermal vent metagenome TaxID=652676 RepID=A0A3B0TP45_9ZZZZ
MLSAISVRNIVLIDRLDLDLKDGLSVLTGETGAGKSILLDALTLALGGRGDQGLVRKGAVSGQVTGVFDLGHEHGANQLLRENGFEAEGELILRRVQYSDGRTKALVNDQPISANLLRRVGAMLVEIHGQHDERALVDVSTHRQLLDAFGQLGQQGEAVKKIHANLLRAQQHAERQRQIMENAAKDEEFASHAVAELEQMSCKAGEEAELAERRQRLMALEGLVEEVRDADQILSGPGAPSGAIASLLRRLQRKEQSQGAIFQAVAHGLDNSLQALEEAADALEVIKREMDFDPEELNRVEERLFALRGMARKHKVSPDELVLVLERYRGELAALGDGAAELARLNGIHEKFHEQYIKAARTLSEARKAAALDLQAAVDKELPDLKLGSAHFIIVQEADYERISPDGFDQISFEVQTNPGTKAGPMLKVASGGELSRFLLALKVALAERGSAPVLIFDEIDSGVGGAVSDAIGRRLARLADKVQVLCVTHAPQVAARARQHLLIEKQSHDKGISMHTKVRLLDSNARGEEIARMLAGAKVSAEARAAAKRLISEVG